MTRIHWQIIVLLLAALLVSAAWRLRVPRAGQPTACAFPVGFVQDSGERIITCLDPAAADVRDLLRHAGRRDCLPQREHPLAPGDLLVLGADCSWTLKQLSGEELLTLRLPIDLNRAAAADLAALPRIGATLAERIVSYRADHGPFARIEDLVAVRGIGEKTFNRLQPFVVAVLSDNGTVPQGE